MEWSEILELKAWTPLKEIAEQPERLADGLYKVGSDAYVFTRIVNRQLEQNDPDAPFVTGAYWAANADAVRRILGGGDPTIGVGAPSKMPPQELLLGTNGTYGELVRRARTLRDSFAESASYSKTGKFLYKLISCGRFEYCFLDNQKNDCEPTFLIQIALVRA